MPVTAAMLAIGDELLSGRTRDANIYHLAGWLGKKGINLCEVRIVADDLDAIAQAVNDLRRQYTYLFTSGGIGPTHDDITFEAIARAFDCPLEVNGDAMGRLEAWYGAKGEVVTPERARMATMPRGATLVNNPASGAPGLMIENVVVMAGVPRIFNSMLEGIAQTLEAGEVVCSRAVTARALPESKLARQLKDIQSALQGVTLGSYPIDGDELGVTIVARSTREDLVNTAIESVVAAMRALGVEPEEGDHY